MVTSSPRTPGGTSPGTVSPWLPPPPPPSTPHNPPPPLPPPPPLASPRSMPPMPAKLAAASDFNLTLSDNFIAELELNLVVCCNELNAGYSADGYARARGIGTCVVTVTVSGLSIINDTAGVFIENLLVICNIGGPNSNNSVTNWILHHTIGLPDLSQEVRCFQTITCFQAIVNHLEDAHEQIDMAILTALKESKPL